MEVYFLLFNQIMVIPFDSSEGIVFAKNANNCLPLAIINLELLSSLSKFIMTTYYESWKR